MRKRALDIFGRARLAQHPHGDIWRLIVRWVRACGVAGQAHRCAHNDSELWNVAHCDLRASRLSSSVRCSNRRRVQRLLQKRHDDVLDGFSGQMVTSSHGSVREPHCGHVAQPDAKIWHLVVFSLVLFWRLWRLNRQATRPAGSDRDAELPPSFVT